MAIVEPIKPNLKDLGKEIEYLSNTLGITKITSRILINRGIQDIEEARIFLNPSTQRLTDPFELEDMDKGVERIKVALSVGEKIAIYGDYDVDGMTASTLLYDYFMGLGIKVNVYIPNRHDEGYGINKEAIRQLHEKGTDLIISVDCGIASIDEVEFARDLGIDMIITDHHQWGPKLPRAYAVINPTRNPKYHQKNPLAGVGVAAKLVHAMGGLDAIKGYMDLIALGTIADVVPLIGDNRIFVYQGLKIINESPRPGIKALIQNSGYDDRKISTGSVAFGLAPRLNAAGRIDDPLLGFNLLSSKSLLEAIPMAAHLEDQNRLRREIEADIVREAEEMLPNYVNISRDKIIVLGKEGWNPGVIGIAASRLSEKYSRPCILIGIEEGFGVGSARSIKGFNIYEALKACSHILVKFGGHEQAAGLTLKEEDIGELRDSLVAYCREEMDDEMLIPSYIYDTPLTPPDISYELANELERLHPHGIGNPTPSFLLSDIKVEDSRRVGEAGKHLKLSMGFGQGLWDGIAFGMGDYNESLRGDNRVRLLANLEKNQWRGVSKLQFNIKHLDIMLDAPQDWDKFLGVFHFKFFDAFYDGFMYNMQYGKDLRVPVITHVEMTSLSRALSDQEKSPVGNLFLLNSPSNIKKLLDGILSRDPGNRPVFRYGYPDKGSGIGINACILAPKTHRIPYDFYERIYIFEEELPGLMVAPGNLPEAKINVIDSGGNPGSILDEEYMVKRLDFVAIYRWLRSLPPGRKTFSGWNEFLEDYRNVIDEDINGFKVRLMLEVFKELDFIKVDEGSNFVRIYCIPDPAPRKLEESPILMYYNKWIDIVMGSSLKEESK